ncbi:MAG TPA: hypothetical protein VGH27_22385 [Streptosporangiaceae bacterium]
MQQHAGGSGTNPAVGSWNGSAWAQVANPPGTADFGSVSCPTPAGCYVIVTGVVDHWDGGTGWTTAPLETPPGAVSWSVDSLSQSYDSTQGWFDLAYVLQPSSRGCALPIDGVVHLRVI